MLAFTNAKEKNSPTIIGAGCNLTGNITTDHTVQIHGLVVGDIVADIVVIGRGGRVEGTVRADSIFLHGTLDGRAVVNVANIFNAAVMSGTLEYKTLNITGNTGLDCKLAKRKEMAK